MQTRFSGAQAADPAAHRPAGSSAAPRLSPSRVPIPMAIESGLAAHFMQPGGKSVPGTSWLVRIEYGGRPFHARVKALLAADASRATRRDEHYQARATMQYLLSLIESGWNPAQEREHTITIGNPPGSPPRRWWRFW